MHKFAWLALLLIAGVASGTASAQGETPEAASAVVADMIATVQHALSDAKLSVQEREQEFGRVLHDQFDVPAISRYVLGPYSASASPQEMDVFAGLMQRWMINAFAGSMGGFGDAKIKMVETRPYGPASVVVTSEIVQPNDPPIRIDWRLHQDEGHYRIVDLYLQGISLSLVQREQMAAVISQNGGTVAGLNLALERRLAGNNGEGALAASAVH
jgi:phospholipid transport system substrate-binding protein